MLALLSWTNLCNEQGNLSLPVAVFSVARTETGTEWWFSDMEKVLHGRSGAWRAYTPVAWLVHTRRRKQPPTTGSKHDYGLDSACLPPATCCFPESHFTRNLEIIFIQDASPDKTRQLQRHQSCLSFSTNNQLGDHSDN